MTSPTPMADRRVVVLSGGVGGARLVDGLAACLPPDRLTVVVNTGDDFSHWGLHVCPDLDTVMYTLSGLSHEARGWGLAEESFNTLAQVARLGGPDWFRLGDRDLATHLTRTAMLAEGRTLSEVTRRLNLALGVHHPILPMSDAPRPTIIDTAEHGPLTFQDWFVRHRTPPARRVRFDGSTSPAPGVLAALRAADLVLIAPSNPYVSIDPIITLDGVRDLVQARPVIAVSPIVRGRAVKGPLADMLRDLDARDPTPQAIVEHYAGLLTGIVVERGDEGAVTALPSCPTDTVMTCRAERVQLARDTLAFAEGLL